MKTGAVIVAAGMSTRMKQFKQLMKIGNLTMAERVVYNFKRAGVDDIVMVTGYRSKQLQKSLDTLCVEFVENTEYESTDMFESAKLGLEALYRKCDRILFCPVDIPFFSDETVNRVLDCNSKLVIPRYNGKNGHPISIASELVPKILSFKGDRGLKGALEATGVPIDYIDVDDRGSVMDADTREDYEKLVDLHNERIMRPSLRVGIASAREFFTEDSVRLMEEIDRLGSVKEACRHIGISYSKGWEIINTAEDGIGYRLVERQTGGKYGGAAYLTDRGRELVVLYRQMERELSEKAEDMFDHIF